MPPRMSLVQQIPLAPELQREAHAGQTVAPPPSNGAAEAAQSLAGEFGRISHQVGALADHAAQVEGTRQGHLAGMDPEWRAGNDITIRGEAFDRAGRETALARIRVGIHNDIEQTALKHQADPKGLAAALQSKASGWLEGSDPGLAPEIQNLFASGSMAAQREATRQLWSRQAAEQRGALQAELDRTLRSVHQMAFASGLDPAADAAIAGLVARMEGAIARTGPAGQRLVDPATAVKLLANTKEEVATARLYGAFDRLPDVAAKQALIEQLDKDFAGSKGLAASFDLPTFQKVKGHLESELRKDTARGRQANAVLVHAVSEVERRAREGEPVQPAELATLQASVATSGNGELAQKLGDGIDNLAFMQAFKTLPAPEMRAALDQLRQTLAGDPASLGDRGRAGRNLKAAEAMLEKAESQIKASPLGWEARVGMAQVTPLASVDLAQAGAATAWGGARVAQAEDAARRHALGTPVYLLPDEKRRLAKQFEQGGEAGLAAVRFVREAFGAKAETVLGEIGNEAPAGALLGELALRTGPTPGVLDAAEGLHARTQKGYKPVAPSAEKAKVYADEVVGTALGQNPGYMTQAMRVADAIYETRAYRAGKIEAFDDKLWKQALREALGEHEVAGRKYGGLFATGTFGFGQKVVLPPDVAQDKASATISALRPEDLAVPPVHRNGKPLTAQELRGATLVTVEPGKYLVALGNPQKDPKWATDGTGKAYVLDLGAALPALRRRRPDLR